ncbi:hypothetical protein [Pantoea anthophila]|uniref:hypothetical protein n=1 Tax=Pantoea anthophila TaxID=470931 RepID=UPI003018F2D3
MNMKTLSLITGITSVVAPLFMLRTYLGYFDNAGLITEDMANTGILNSVFFFISLSVIVFIMIIFMPSFIFGLAVPKQNRHLWNYESIKDAVARSMVLNTIYSVSLFFMTAYLASRYNLSSTLSVSIALTLLFLGVVFLNFIIINRFIHPAAVTKTPAVRLEMKLRFCLYYPVAGIMIIGLNCSALLLILQSVNHEKLTDGIFDFMKVSSLLIFMCVMNLVPGVTFVLLHGRMATARLVCLTAGATFMTLLLMSSLMPSVPLMIINRAMIFSGIADFSTRSYLIDRNIFPEEIFENKAWEKSEKHFQQGYVVRGVMVYSLNKIKLLCPGEIKPLYINVLRFVPWDSNYDSEAKEMLRRQSSLCQPFTEGGVRRISRANAEIK